MKILGIDPSYSATGWAVLDCDVIPKIKAKGVLPSLTKERGGQRLQLALMRLAKKGIGCGRHLHC